MAGPRVSWDLFSDFARVKNNLGRNLRNYVFQSLAFVCLPTYKIELIIQASLNSTKLLWGLSEVRDRKVLWKILKHYVVLTRTPPQQSLNWTTPHPPSSSLEQVPLWQSQLSVVFHHSTYYCWELNSCVIISLMMGSSNRWIGGIPQQARSFCPQCLTKHLEQGKGSVFVEWMDYLLCLSVKFHFTFLPLRNWPQLWIT